MTSTASWVQVPRISKWQCWEQKKKKNNKSWKISEEEAKIKKFLVLWPATLRSNCLPKYIFPTDGKKSLQKPYILSRRNWTYLENINATENKNKTNTHGKGEQKSQQASYPEVLLYVFFKYLIKETHTTYASMPKLKTQQTADFQAIFFLHDLQAQNTSDFFQLHYRWMLLLKISN